MLYVKNFPRCARQFVKNFLRKLMKNQWCMLNIFRAAHANFKEETAFAGVQKFSGGDAWQNSVCRVQKISGGDAW